ncbi:MAG TPA: cytochrome c3 family protein [Pyrinomonadaceae bacterium]|jgi:NAD-dependent SIR2 family protein deacetylase|nr:cytochrome c3 family protein [Pyrinomonadaceae bacterium]
MAQIFHRYSNTLARVVIFGAVFLVAGVSWVAYMLDASTYATEVGVARVQPVPFSHRHHVSDDGIDCRYCHTTVETSAFAGIPPVSTCMNCHSQIWTDSPMLEPVRESFRTGRPLKWVRVHELPDYVYFNHSIHVSKGVGCVTCHGRVDQMPLTWQAEPLSMQWCLRCHRNPENYLRPREQVFNMGWQPSEEQRTLGRRLVREYHVRDSHALTNCSTCHF